MARDSAEQTFAVSKHCTAAWNGDVAYFQKLMGEEKASLSGTGFWLYSASDETKGRQVLVYLQDEKRYRLVPFWEVRPVDHDTRLEPLFFAVANDQRAVVRHLLALAQHSPALQKIAIEPQFITTVKLDVKPPPAPPEGKSDATANGNGNGVANGNGAAAASSSSSSSDGGYKYTLVLHGAGGKPVTPLQVAIVNGHTEVVKMLQQSAGQTPENCRTCDAGGDCTLM